MLGYDVSGIGAGQISSAQLLQTQCTTTHAGCVSVESLKEENTCCLVINCDIYNDMIFHTVVIYGTYILLNVIEL